MSTSSCGCRDNGPVSRAISRLQAALVAVALACPVAHAQQPATPTEGDGRAVFVRALATAETSGLQRALAQKDWVYAADTLRTSPAAIARFVMRDHTLLAMKQDTTVVLSEYQFKLEDSTASKMVTKVTSGSLRALTGLIDKRDPDKVVLQTPLATAGVRGTAIRVDLYPSGVEEIIFDFGQGWVGNKAGRVDVKTGWGARVISATILPELFKVKQDPEDFAFIALDLLGRAPPDDTMGSPLPSDGLARRKALGEISDRAAARGRKLDPADAVVLLGLLEQVPNPDEARTLAILVGLLKTIKDPDMSLIQTEVELVPARAVAVLDSGVQAGGKLERVLHAVLSGLLPIWPDPVDPVLRRAEKLGLDPARAREILDTVRQPVPCRRSGKTSSGASGEVSCVPPAAAPVAASTPAPIGQRYSAVRTGTPVHSVTS